MRAAGARLAAALSALSVISALAGLLPPTARAAGTAPAGEIGAAAQSGTPVPSLHSALFVPDREPTIKAASTAELIALRELMPVAGHAGPAR